MSLLVFSADVADEAADAVDVISEDYAADDFHQDHGHRFLVARGSDVSEADGQHNGRAPVVGPNILLIPRGVSEPPFPQPIGLGVDFGHAEQHH